MAGAAKTTLRKWGYVITCSLLAAGIMIEAFFLIPVVRQQSNFANDGRMARERQIRVKPVTCKEHIDAFKRGVISLHDLKLVGCP